MKIKIKIKNHEGSLFPTPEGRPQTVPMYHVHVLPGVVVRNSLGRRQSFLLSKYFRQKVGRVTYVRKERFN